MKPVSSSINKIQSEGLTFIRIVTGGFMMYHGWEIFEPEKMKVYFEWEQFKTSSWLVYAGKASELIGGFFLAIGLLTRIAALLLAGTMLYISLFMGSGKIWYEDQHPFLFVLLALVFFFVGGGPYSIDHFFFNKKISKH
jgi:putative oxidoreductase